MGALTLKKKKESLHAVAKRVDKKTVFFIYNFYYYRSAFIVLIVAIMNGC